VLRRDAAARGVLMNTRGLTEFVILTVGPQRGLLDRGLYSLMVVMALVTTAMTGPALRWALPATPELALPVSGPEAPR
jgi:Kef-type K+ transport system membrane component KefB